MTHADLISPEGQPPREGALQPRNGTSADGLVARVATLIERNGLRHALGELNARTRFRFTGAYRAEPPMLRSVAVFDRENPELALRADVRIQDSYCSLILADGEPVSIEDARREPHLLDHPARRAYAAYCGVPLIGADGTLFGTLCHFDPRPRIGSAAELEVLERIAPLVARHLAGS